MGKTILTPNQQQLLERAATTDVITSVYYLTGGAALSEFFFQHRLSEDLDFFSEQPMDERALHAWIKETAHAFHTEVTFQTLRGQYIFYFHFPQEVIKVDFAHFPFPVLGTYTKYKQLRIASIEDAAVNKLQAILTRLRARDYVDLYVIMARGEMVLATILSNYRLKFDVTVPIEQVAKRFQAVIDAGDIPRFLGTIEWRTVEEFFLTQAKLLQPKILQ